MSNFEEFLESKSFKNFMAKLYGIGAAIVILGALFKIMHWPGANFMLIVGMGTEVLIFFVSAFEPIHMDLDWTLVYPELAGMEGHGHSKGKKEDKKSLTQELDKMMEEAKIGPDLIQSLGTGLKNLSDNTSKMNMLSDATVATNEFTDNMKTASKKITTLSDAYDKASSSIGGSISDLEKASGRTSQALESITASVEDAKKFKEQIATLNENLASLNTVYGNMLSAMNIRK